MVTILSILIINGLTAQKGSLNKKSMFKKISLGFMMFLVFGMFSVIGVSKVQAADLACTIEYPDGRIEEGTWINGTCQPNGSIVIATDYKVNVRPVSFFEKIKLAFTFNAEKKAELLVNFSNRNFELAKQEFAAGNTVKANIYLEKSEMNTEKAEKAADKISDEKKKEQALNSLSTTASNRTTVLTEVKAKIESAQAKEAIQNAIDTQIDIKSSVDEKKDALIDLKLNADIKVDLKESEKEGNFNGVGNILGGVDVAVKDSVSLGGKSPCNINIQANQQVSFPLSINGQFIIGPSTSNVICPLGLFEGQVGTVQAYSSSGTSLSSWTSLMIYDPNFDYQPGTYNFSGTLNMSSSVSSGQTVILRFTKEDPSGAPPVSFDIPVIVQ